ncbi:hypothetical protein FNL07_12105 [Staphylococcus haemolyticus]|nr:hypothetical protein FNL07_12105 [Staphylococcus haemolyticus]
METPRHLAHGEFVKIYEELPLNASSVSCLGVNVLYQLATLPEPERTKEQKKPPTIINSGRA